MLKSGFAALLLAAATSSASAQAATCSPGAYGIGDGNYVVVVTLNANPAAGQRYLFRDGRRGLTTDQDAPVSCGDGFVEVRALSAPARWPALTMTKTDTSFVSVGAQLTGQLIEPAGANGGKRPLVVMVHGSERTPAIGNAYAYSLAAQGISVFVYDKRGTGGSEGEYTQNFALLAADAAAAFNHVTNLANGRYSRAGYFGGSQGGWVAPLAATQSKADFVAVGFGLVASPIEEDREQMISEARSLGLDSSAEALINRLAQATGKLLLSSFTTGYDELEAVRREMATKDWADKIHGEHSGAMLRLSNEELRRIGRPRFDNLELIWNYDAIGALRRLQVPLLWVLAAEDREAPVAGTRAALSKLKSEGKAIDVYLFPDTDHGMIEFKQNPDGSRTVTRITDGYLQLLGDWIKGDTKGPYGRSRIVLDEKRPS